MSVKRPSCSIHWKLLPLVSAIFSVPWAAATQPLVIKDNFTGGTATMSWDARTGACLTAGTDSVGLNKIPACVGLPYYSGVTLGGGQTGTLPDTAGNGALRFTNNSNSETGAVISNFTFPSSSGLAVTFSTVTYGGTGADGISFFLMDGSKPGGVGAEGGSLAYSCSNTNNVYDGLVGAYLGLGMDEYGNFLNQSDNSSSGYGFQAGRIGLRGAGNTAWSWLTATYPSKYPSNLSAANRKAAVQNSCRTGRVWDYSNIGDRDPVQTNTPLSNYAVIPNANAILPNTTPLYSNATTRPTAIPITYKLKITQNGLLSLAYSYNAGTLQPVLTDQSILDANGALPNLFKFGFAGSTGGSNNIHEVTCFQAGPADTSTSSAGINTQQSGQVKTGTQVYLAYYHPNNWWGQLTSQNLTYSSANNGTVSISPTANWDASCVLTGGNCSATAVNSMNAETSANRNILTWNGSAGIPFQWDSLTTVQTSALADVNRLNYLRGDRSNEIDSNGNGAYRQRTSVLGDIIDSSPTWVGPPAAPYADAWQDRLYSTTPPENSISAQSYSAFVTAKKTRLNVVYVGADDGLLHGFRAGSYDSSSNFVSSLNDGKEVLAYMPAPVVQKIHSATATDDYSSAQYAHAYSVNGTPYAGDLFYGGAWHSWLVGGLGSGGKGIYALDITNPSNFSEAIASTLVMGEWTPASTCDSNNTCGNNMGQTYGTPQIRRFHNGMWGFVFGNGLNSSTGKAGIYIVTINPTTAAQTMYYLDSGSTAANNGITDTTPADLDGDHVTDYVYAGDILGHVWRFDLTSASPASWGVSQFGFGAATPLFTTPGGQPIATKVTVAIVPAKVGASRVVVGFGTGRVTAPQTVSSAATYTTASQSLYGIWDWDMTTWNTAAPSSQKGSLTAPQKSAAASVSTADLQNQTITGTFTNTTNGVSGYRTVSNSKVCWQNSTDCVTDTNNKYGWKLSLPSSGEQVIYSPILSQGAFIVNTTIPASNSPLSCSVAENSGWTYAVDPATGGAFVKSFFGDGSNNFVSLGGGQVGGIQIGAVGSPSVVTASNSPYLVNQTNSGVGHIDKIAPPGGTLGNRMTWQQIR
jgi:type IV pilus assembly protein PilY1